MAYAGCSTKEQLNEEGDYLGCEITVDGKTTSEKIPDSACAAYCQLLTVKNKAETYQEFSHFKEITTKPGEQKETPALVPAPAPASAPVPAAAPTPANNE